MGPGYPLSAFAPPCPFTSSSFALYYFFPFSFSHLLYLFSSIVHPIPFFCYAFTTWWCLQRRYVFGLSDGPFICLSGQILLPRYLMNSLNNQEYSLASTDDCWPDQILEVKGEGHTRPLMWQRRAHRCSSLEVHLLPSTLYNITNSIFVFTVIVILPPNTVLVQYVLSSCDVCLSVCHKPALPTDNAGSCKQYHMIAQGL